MFSIENNFLKIKVAQKGAELKSIYNKQTKTELLWQGNPEFWAGQAPILFPVVGELKDGFHTVNGNKHEMARHGIVRKSTAWQIEKMNDNTIVCKFVSSNETLESYPFEFEFVVRYHISQNTLHVTHVVTNTDNKNIPVSIGGHPAFNCPLNNGEKLTDYQLIFEKAENSVRHVLADGIGIFNGETEKCLDNTDTLQLSETVFDKDALVFKDLESKKVSLVGPNGKILSVTFNDFPFLGVWAKPKAPYVCIEPWIGHADTFESSQNLFDKEGSLSLKPNQEYRATFSIHAE